MGCGGDVGGVGLRCDWAGSRNHHRRNRPLLEGRYYLLSGRR
jgi:hypothetical protein